MGVTDHLLDPLRKLSLSPKEAARSQNPVTQCGDGEVVKVE